ncbi:MAG TPA: polysaccharide deacetylase family protein [Bacillota bacterium]|nr:polysaccharide deacetylase family protein [Bacillota bacterium]
MHRYQRIVHLFVFVILVALTYDTQYNPFSPTVTDVSIVDVAKVDNELYQEIKKKSVTYNEESQDAYIDRVWKKTPGRNGLKVNVEESYEQMKKKGTFDESLLVYEEIPPETTLQQLPAAPIYRGHPEKEMVALLINVSWGEEHLPKILEVLDDHHVQATFFIEGKWAKEHADFVKMIDQEGHLIGNHAYNHPDMARISHQAITDQLSQTNDIIKGITGKTPQWFAPPSGSYSDEVVDIAYHLKMETILWTVDTIDWKNPSVSVMINRVMGKIHPGATILMHPTSAVAEGLDPLIDEIKEKEYKIGTVEQLLSEKR